MKGLQDWLQRWFSRFKALSPRERALVVLVLVALLGFAFDLLCLQPLGKERKRLQGEVERVAAEIEVRQAELAAVTADSKEGGAAQDGLDQLKRLRDRQALSERELRRALAALVAQGRPDQILREILAPYPGLRVVSAVKEEAQPFFFEKEGELGEGRILRQNLEVIYEGSYLDCIGYMRRLEEASLQIFWDEFELETLTAPKNRLRIKLHYLFYDRGKSHA
ncbi:MAG: type II secretion system protein M [Deltaproteobacteria bacterium]|nr:type II secretion system protein M [Deltaproteobacteria bacterium]